MRTQHLSKKSVMALSPPRQRMTRRLLNVKRLLKVQMSWTLPQSKEAVMKMVQRKKKLSRET